MKNRVFLLWLEGLNPESLSAVPSVAKLAAGGVDLQLAPLPLVEKGVSYYQTLTGTGSAKFGRFDAVHPEKYLAHEDAGVPDGAFGHLLPDLLRLQKLSVTFLETKDRTALASLSDQTYDCAVVRMLNMDNAGADEVDSIVQRCVELATPETHIFVLTDVWNPAPRKYVNINDFLVDAGLLEVGASRKREDIVWSETLAYGLGTGQLWVNLRGRESQGIVGSGREYKEVCDALVNELRTNWRDPQTNELVVEQVLRKEEAYSGEYLFKAPDLIVTYRPGYAASPNASALDFDGQSVSETETASSDAPAAAPFARLIAGGSSLSSGTSQAASLVDIVPTILYLLDRSIPMHVDGNVISSIFTPAYREQIPVKRFDSDDDLLSDEEEGMIVDRLRDLGYLG
jgi:hypothetical protein